MLRITSELTGYQVRASDGDVGKCKDFLFDDEHWTVRYMVVDTGGWLSDRKVVLSPLACRRPDWESRTFPVDVTRKQVEAAPLLDERAPVSRRDEMAHLTHYSWPFYWVGDRTWGSEVSPVGLRARGPLPPSERRETGSVATLEDNPHLRSVNEVTGYHIEARDGEIGHVETFVMDDETWTLRYMVVDTRNWLPGKKVLVSPEWIDKVSWPNRKVRVDLRREAIKESPAFDPDMPVNREVEARLYDYYGRPRYWEKT